MDLNFFNDSARAKVLDELVAAGYVVQWRHHKLAPTHIDETADVIRARMLEDCWLIVPDLNASGLSQDAD